VKVGKVGDKLYAFVGLERISGFMTYDITNPENVKFANYLNDRDFSDKIAGDVSPEGLAFVDASDSPTGRPLVLVGNEVSGTVSVNEIQVDPIVTIENISLDQTEVALEEGETVQLNVTVQPENATEQDLVWTSSNEQVAKVDENGLVTAVAAGNAIITVSTKDGQHQATTEITVTAVKEEIPEDENDKELEEPVKDEDKNNNDQDKDPLNKEESKQKEDGKPLPDTATDNYTSLLAGGIIISVGGVLYYLNRRKEASEE
jgi:LPXTG-motif cell wall-anchored protein